MNKENKINFDMENISKSSNEIIGNLVGVFHLIYINYFYLGWIYQDRKKNIPHAGNLVITTYLHRRSIIFKWNHLFLFIAVSPWATQKHTQKSSRNCSLCISNCFFKDTYVRAIMRNKNSAMRCPSIPFQQT